MRLMSSLQAQGSNGGTFDHLKLPAFAAISLLTLGERTNG